jgi:Fuc2NAc and GlcNAc transferase
MESAMAAVATFVIALVLTGVARRYLESKRWLDHPNSRSSHSAPTPRGGGLAIVFACILSWVALNALGTLESDLMVALSLGGTAIALIGLLDDRFGVHPGLRLAVHLLAAIFAVTILGGCTEIRVGNRLLEIGWVGNAIAVLGIASFLNLFNFMDGIDGLATSEAVFMCLVGALLLNAAGSGPGLVAASICTAAACLGFLPWNWSPAKIFMGDVGSGFLGYVIAVFAVAAEPGKAGVLPWLILAGVFVADATVTLVRRVLRNERFYQAHRSHAYQQLARRLNSHSRVTMRVAAANCFWLAPWAWIAVTRPEHAIIVALVALIPMFILVTVLGAKQNTLE